MLYRQRPKPGHTYRQIVVIEVDQQFVVHILGGDVIQSDPKFDATSENAEVFFHSDLKSALDDTDKEFDASVNDGWTPYGHP